MVYRRRRRTRKNSVRREVARQLAKSVEVKSKNLQRPSAAIDTTGEVYQIWPSRSPAVGDGRDERIGNEIYSLSHNLKLKVVGGAAGGNTMRYAIIRLRNQYTTTIGDLFENTSFVAFGSIYANWDYSVVEKVYMDKTLVINTSSSYNKIMFRKHYLKLTEKVEYDSILGNSQNNLYFVLVGSASPGSPDPVLLTTLLKSRYTDS